MKTETLMRAVERAAPGSEGLIATAAEHWVAQGKTEALREGEAEGIAKGKAQAVLAVLEARGLAVSTAQRARVLGGTDLAQIESWGRKAVTAKAAAALFAAPKRPAKTRR